MAIKWRRQYADPERDEVFARLDAVGKGPQPDLTVQSFREDSDINVLVKRFGVGPELPRPNVAPFYGDFSEARDFRESLDMIREAEHSFAELPAKVRRRFANDPAELVAFLRDEGNRDEAESLGLVVKRPVDALEPPAAPAGEPPAAPPPASE